jgi:hypothetical protein
MRTIPAQDMYGRDLTPGDVFAYALTIDRSAKMGVYVVDSLVLTKCHGVHRLFGEKNWSQGEHTLVKVKARQVAVSYGSVNEKLVTLAMTNERAVLLKEKRQWTTTPSA